MIMLASWLVMSQHVQQREEQGRLFLQARPPKVNHRGYRGQLTVPQAFAGLRVSPSVYRWMLGHYGATGLLANLSVIIEYRIKFTELYASTFFLLLVVFYICIYLRCIYVNIQKLS